MRFWFLFKFENRCLGTSSDKNSINTHFKSISIWLPLPPKAWFVITGCLAIEMVSFPKASCLSVLCPSLLSVLMPRQPAPPYLLVVFLGLLQAARWCSAASLNCWVSTAGFISAIPRIRKQTHIEILYVQTGWARNTERELVQPQSSTVTLGLFSKVFMTHIECEGSAQRPSWFLSWLRSLSLMLMFPVDRALSLKALLISSQVLSFQWLFVPQY